MMARIGRSRKAITAGLAAFTAAVVSGGQDGALTAPDWALALSLAVLAAGGVYLAPNDPPAAS